jgi:hypothetical protein
VQWIEKDVRRSYQKPALKKLTFSQATQGLLGRAREFLDGFRPERSQPVQPELPKRYETPAFRKLTAEQARLLLIGHASVGDQGAKDLLELIFPDNRPPE